MSTKRARPSRGGASSATPRVRPVAAKATASRARRPAAPRTKPAAAGAPAVRRRPRPTIFISYRHEHPTTLIARNLYEALLPAADTWDAEVFWDRPKLEPGVMFHPEIMKALDRTTHFVALLDNGYWASEYCRKEISRAVDRFEAKRNVRLLFVKAQEFDLRHFVFDTDRRVGRITSRDPLIVKVGDLQFLGPYNAAGRLDRLAWERRSKLSDQLAALVRELGRVVEPAGR